MKKEIEQAAPGPTRTIEEHANALSTDPVWFAAARVKGQWIDGQEITEREYREMVLAAKKEEVR